MRLRLDSGDPDLDSYHQLILPAGWSKVVRPRLDGGANPAHAEMFAEHPDLDWYGLLADDVVPRTPGWDKALIEAAGKDKLAYGNDGFQGEKLATHPVIGGDLARLIGWLVCPDLGHSYADTALHEIALRSHRAVFLKDILLEHMHPLAGKAEEDATYRYKQGFVADTTLYYKWRGLQMRPIVDKLLAA